MNKLSFFTKVLEAKLEAYAQLSRDIAWLKDEIKEICPHTETYIERSYFSGSYYDKAYTDYTRYCSTCKKKLEKWDEGHGYYG